MTDTLVLNRLTYIAVDVDVLVELLILVDAKLGSGLHGSGMSRLTVWTGPPPPKVKRQANE